MESLVLSEIIGPIAVVTLNRAQRHNSLVPEFLEEILEHTQKISSDPSIRVMILQANGPNFSTGGDAKGFVEHTEDLENYSYYLVGLLNEVILTLLDSPFPVVAAVQGQVTGGSMGLVLACDIVLVSENASFTPYYSAVGVSPDGGWTVLLPSIIGKQRTASTLMLNRTISSPEAVKWGLATLTVPNDKLQDKALDIAKTIAESKPGSIFHSKKLLNLDLAAVSEGLEAERRHFVDQITTEEGREAFGAFLRDLRSSKP